MSNKNKSNERERGLKMAYQESYLKMRDNNGFDKLVKCIKDYGKNGFECSKPVEIITLKKPITTEANLKFCKGTKFIYVVGERYGQRSAESFFECCEDVPKQILDNLEIYFTESFPSDDMFENNERTKIAKHEEFIWGRPCKNVKNNQLNIENHKKAELKNLLKNDNEELPVNPFTGNQVLSFNSIEKNINSIINELEKGNLLIFQYPQGDCLFLNNTGMASPYKMIQYDPKNGNAIRAELPKEAIKILVDSLSKDKMVQNYSLFMVKKVKEDLIEDFAEITNGLLNLVTPNDNYKIRKLG